MTCYSEKITIAGIKKALNMSKSLVISRCPEDLGLLLSLWSSESHTYIAVWGEFFPTLEDVII